LQFAQPRGRGVARGAGLGHFSARKRLEFFVSARAGVGPGCGFGGPLALVEGI
jgi:hypothetical protein